MLPHADDRPISRRAALRRWGCGFGGLALAGLCSCPRSDRERLSHAAGGSAPSKAKRVIFLYMEGGPSQMDTFDPKPRLNREHGQPIGMETPPTQFATSRTVFGSPYRFRRHGRVGAQVSEIFPNLAPLVDEMTIVRSMVSEHSEHTTANYFLNTGYATPGRPSMGAWLSYGLGNLADDLPSYVVLECGHMPLGGLDCFSNGFLPARHQGIVFRRGPAPIPNLASSASTLAAQRQQLDLVAKMNRLAGEVHGQPDPLEALIANQELAFRMQASIPDLLDLRSETPATRSLYGLDDPETETFARSCLLARRLAERGARFIQLLPPKFEGITSWDQHDELEKHHRTNALAVDRPIAGLLTDLRERGLLEDTIVMWGGEFGRTPTAQKTANGDWGRDHNPFGFTMWLAGGGIRRGHVHGSTDDYGYYAQSDPVTIHDLHATILHLMGIDHTELTYRHGGRDFRLTDVYGEVVPGLLA